MTNNAIEKTGGASDRELAIPRSRIDDAAMKCGDVALGRRLHRIVLP